MIRGYCLCKSAAVPMALVPQLQGYQRRLEVIQLLRNCNLQFHLLHLTMKMKFLGPAHEWEKARTILRASQEKREIYSTVLVR